MATLKEWRRDFNRLPKWQKFSIISGFIIGVAGLIFGSYSIIDQETKSESTISALSLVKYSVEIDGQYLTPKFYLKNVGEIPIEYYVNESDIDRVSFYSGSNLTLEINARQIKTTDFEYHNRGEIIFPDSVSEFSFTSSNLQVFQVPSTRFEMDINLEIRYWAVDKPSKICIFYSKYTFFSNENKIYPVTQNINCI